MTWTWYVYQYFKRKSRWELLFFKKWNNICKILILIKELQVWAYKRFRMIGGKGKRRNTRHGQKAGWGPIWKCPVWEFQRDRQACQQLLISFERYPESRDYPWPSSSCSPTCNLLVCSELQFKFCLNPFSLSFFSLRFSFLMHRNSIFSVCTHFLSAHPGLKSFL